MVGVFINLLQVSQCCMGIVELEAHVIELGQQGNGKPPPMLPGPQ
jgi:hypothetical protein